MKVEGEVINVGESLGIVLPDEALAALKVGEGGTLIFKKDSDSSFILTRGHPGFQEVMRIAEDCMNRYENAFRELSK